jgi:hypothetical protein
MVSKRNSGTAPRSKREIAIGKVIFNPEEDDEK